MVIKATILAEP